jgi:methylthioribulose-1-phosphate dehydratase
MTNTFEEIAAQLVMTANGFHARGWVLGTSGNLSAVIDGSPLRLAMTPSGVDKGALCSEQILIIDEQTRIISEQKSKPSDEGPLHVRIVKERGAAAVFHTHSIWSTIVSDLHAGDRGIAISGYEMLKGLEGVKTHEHSEWLPILENSQDMFALADSIGAILKEHPYAHGFLLRRHGLYTWGSDLTQARRHVEIFEFLLETIGHTILLTRGR